MKITSALVFFSLAALGRAEPLAQTAAVQTKPDPAAPVVTYLKAGSEPVAATLQSEPLPPGWIAVQLPGPFDGYALNSDLTKSLDVRPGAPIYLGPKTGSGVLVTAAKGDKTQITGLYGKWTKLRLNRDLVGYVQLSPAVVTPAASLVPVASSPDASAPVVSGPGRAADAGGASLTRFFEGTFVSSRRALAPRRPFDWQLDDGSGSRSAYLDVSKLLATEQFDTYVGRTVVVYGTLRSMPGGKDIVIGVESMHLK